MTNVNEEVRGSQTANIGRERPATVHDVARRAGVSAQTVSRLLSGYRGIRPATRARVEDAIAALGYRPNRAARQLRTRRSNRIGVVAHEVFTYGPSRLLRGATRRARELGYTLNIVSADGTEDESVAEVLQTFEEEHVAGVLALALTDSQRRMVDARATDIPILINPAESGIDGRSINEVGAELVARHFVATGHRRVGILLGAGDWIPARLRQAGFLGALEGTDTRCEVVWEGDWSAESGDRAGRAYDPASGVTAIFAANDSAAIGLIHGLTSRGIRVPEDVSVAGFDSIPEGAFLNPSLTSVEPDFDDQGRVAIDALLADIEGRDYRPDRAVPVRLVVRGSTASARS